MNQLIKQAVILAGGRGERLRPLTDTMPKPMVPIRGKPFLEYLIERLKKNGITDIVILLGYLPEVITEYFKDGSRFGVRIRYSIGAVEDETGTRLRNAKDMLDNRFLLLYSDNYWPLDLPAMLETYHAAGAPALVTVYSNRDGRGEYGSKNNTRVEADSIVTCYDKTMTAQGLNAIDIGFFILEKTAVFQYMPKENFSFEKEVMPRLIAERALSAYMTDKRYYTITTVERVREMEEVIDTI